MTQTGTPNNDFYYEQLAYFRRNAQYELERAANFGGERQAPLEVRNSLDRQREQITHIKQWLRQAGAPVDDQPEDVPTSAGSPPASAHLRSEPQGRDPVTVPGALVGSARGCRMSVHIVSEQLPWTLRLGLLALILIPMLYVGRELLNALPALLALALLLVVLVAIITACLGRGGNVVWELLGRVFGGIVGGVLGLLGLLLRIPAMQGGPVHQVLQMDLNLFLPGRAPVPVQLRTLQAAQFISDGSAIAVSGRPGWFGHIQADQIVTEGQTIQAWRARAWGIPVLIVWGGVLWLAFLLLFNGQLPDIAALWGSGQADVGPGPLDPAQPTVVFPTVAQASTRAPAPTHPPALRLARVTGVAPGRLNLRDAPSMESTILSKIVEDSQVELIGDVEIRNGERWQQIRFDNQVGWVSAKYLEIAP